MRDWVSRWRGASYSAFTVSNEDTELEGDRFKLTSPATSGKKGEEQDRVREENSKTCDRNIYSLKGRIGITKDSLKIVAHDGCCFCLWLHLSISKAIFGNHLNTFGLKNSFCPSKSYASQGLYLLPTCVYRTAFTYFHLDRRCPYSRRYKVWFLHNKDNALSLHNQGIIVFPLIFWIRKRVLTIKFLFRVWLLRIVGYFLEGSLDILPVISFATNNVYDLLAAATHKSYVSRP